MKKVLETVSLRNQSAQMERVTMKKELKMSEREEQEPWNWLEVVKKFWKDWNPAG